MSWRQAIDVGTAWRQLQVPTRLFLAFAALHVAWLLARPGETAAFLVGDRAGGRSFNLRALLDAETSDEWMRLLLSFGHPGDHILFLPAYGIAGANGIMLQSIALYCLGIAALYKLVCLFWSARIAAVATTAYMLLPATLFHPHTLVSEAICNPLLIVAVYLVARLMLAERPGLRDAILAGLALAVIGFVRPGFAPLALLLAGLVALLGLAPLKARLMRGATVACLGLSLLAGWSVFAATIASHYPRPASGASLAHNIFLKAERMAVVGGSPAVEAARERAKDAGQEFPTLSFGEYARTIARHPLAFAKVALSDTANLIGNPGVSMVLGRHLGLFDLEERSVSDLNKWRETRDRQGILAVFVLLWQTSPLGLVLNVAGLAAWIGFLGVAAVGAVRLLRERAGGLVPVAVLLLVPGYVTVLTMLAAGYSRWDHRSPMEPFIAILFALGLEAALSWKAAMARRAQRS